MSIPNGADVRFRREGLADAAVLLVARRVVPTMDLVEWGRHLGLEHQELVAAVDRFRARLRPAAVTPIKRTRVKRGPKDRTGQERNMPCPHEGCGKLFYDRQGVGAHMASHRSVACRWCRLDVIAPGIGKHQRYCPQRPPDAA